MFSPAYFAPPAPQAASPERQREHGSTSARSAIAAMPGLPADDAPRLLHRTCKIVLVAGLHAALFAWLANVQTDTVDITAPIRLDVRTIEAPRAAAATTATSAAPIHVAPMPKAVPQREPVRRPEKSMPQKPAASAADSTPQRPAAAASGRADDGAPSTDLGASRPAVAASQSASAGSGAVSAARFDADYLRNPAPPYPQASRRLREQGTVRLDVSVSAEGSATSVRLRQSSGHARLDEAALATVKGWRFIPARRGGEAVVAEVIVPVEFRLDE